MRPPFAFVSYSTRDRNAARQVAEGLRTRGLDVWIDEEQIGLGDSIPSKISDGLSTSDAVLVLVSKQFLASSWCRAEYEPMIVREIERDMTLVLPLRLDDADMPPLLSAKRYLDLRDGITEAHLDELAKHIAFESNRTRVLRLAQPEKSSLEMSVLSMVVSSVLDDFSVQRLTEERLRDRQALIDLYRAIDSLVDRFQALFDQLLEIFVGAGIEDQFYGSAFRVSRIRRWTINRKLKAISTDMREIVVNLDKILLDPSPLRERLAEVLEISFEISQIEDVLVLELSTRAEPRIPGSPWLPRHGSFPDFVDYPMLLGEFGGEILDDFRQLQDKLDKYRRQLRKAVASSDPSSLGGGPRQDV